MCTLYPVKEGNWELCFPANFFYWKLLGSQHLLLKSSLLLTPVTKSCCVQTSITIVVLQLIKKKKKRRSAFFMSGRVQLFYSQNSSRKLVLFLSMALHMLGYMVSQTVWVGKEKRILGYFSCLMPCKF